MFIHLTASAADAAAVVVAAAAAAAVVAAASSASRSPRRVWLDSHSLGDDEADFSKKIPPVPAKVTWPARFFIGFTPLLCINIWKPFYRLSSALFLSHSPPPLFPRPAALARVTLFC